MFFKCKHPANRLHIQKDETRKRISNFFEEVTYHLYCTKCNEKIDIKYSKVLQDFKDYKKEEIIE